MDEPDEVLRYWLGDAEEATRDPDARMRRWFGGGEAIDREIRARFGDLVRRAQAGELAAWEATPRTRLALVIVLDQLSRNVWRGDPRTHAGDALALRLALDAYDRGWDRQLTLEERRWLVMPLLHAEDLAALDRSIPIFEAMASEAGPTERGGFDAATEHARKYRDVIARFGRFPHRNALLGRTSTPAEETFLETWDGPGGKKRPGAARP